MQNKLLSLISSLKSGYKALVIVLTFSFSAFLSFGQKVIVSPHTNLQYLIENGKRLEKASIEEQAKIEKLAEDKGWKIRIIRKNGDIENLVGIDDFGMPVYESDDNNTIAAGTTRANSLYSGGVLGLSLSGSTIPTGKIAIFEGSTPLTSHVEFSGGRILLKNSGSAGSHATHVAGTIMASGVNPIARGMVYGLPELWAFTSSSDTRKMNDNAATLLLSNHSYGTNSGWKKDDDDNWRFLGAWGATEDYKFGWYNDKAEEWDNICYNAPYYLPVKSGGNYRSSNGPAVGEDYYRYNANGSMIYAGKRPAGISSNDGYGTVATYGNAKNVLSVGAVYGLPNGANFPEDIKISKFSAWGPTDDGRIKPDLVADGVGLVSSDYTSNTAYVSKNGTSMSAPNALGTLALLQELYNQENGTFMRAATLKALALGTTSEAGSAPGPDYVFGWGLLNAEKAASAILNNGTTSVVSEKVLNSGGTVTVNVVANGKEPVVATISWTDPAAKYISSSQALNNPALRLINDLDMRASDGTTTFYPWILDPADPEAPATTGDNFRDNTEQIYIESPVAGKTYTFTITHKNNLKNNSPQAFGLIITGVGGAEYCVSEASVEDGMKVENFSFSNISFEESTDCDTYSNHTDQIVEVRKDESYTLSLKTRSCGTAGQTIAKVFIDWNGDGDFDDDGELVATSGTLNIGDNFSAEITIPGNISADTYSRMRIVLAETNDPENVTSCGSYTAGETIDYSIKFIESLTASRLYVKKDATGNNDGNSWEDAFTELSDAFDLANANNQITDIWVAGGIYVPQSNPGGTADNRDRTFAFPARGSEENGLKVYGGFAGTETNLSQRDWRVNRTVLSGDFNEDDVVTGDGATLQITGIDENAFRVFVGNDYALLDGFTVTGGGSVTPSAVSFTINGKPVVSSRGSGGSISEVTGMKIRNIVFYGNKTYQGTGDSFSRGAALYGENIHSVEIENCVFEKNLSRGGGALYLIYSSSATGNHDFKITNSVFIGNKAEESGGAIQINKGAGTINNLILNSTFYNNHAVSSGGGVYLTSTQPGVIKNSIFWNNSGISGREHIYFSSSTEERVVTNCIIQGYTSGDVSGAVTSQISGADPLFNNPGDYAGADGFWMTEDDGLSITENSSAINFGDPNITEPETDITGYTRAVEVSEEDILGRFSAGAYEYRDDDAMAVSLTEFEARPVGDEVRLTWRVESAINFSHFEIEKSVDGLSFRNIGKVDYDDKNVFSFNDLDARTGSQSTLYYRLKLVDIDGSFSYSEIRNVRLESRKDVAIKAFPNPFTDNIKVLADNVAGPVKVTLTAVNGTLVYSKEFREGEKNREITLSNLGHLKEGIYILKIRCETGVQSIKLVKKH